MDDGDDRNPKRLASLAAEERLTEAARRSAVSGSRGLEELCRHVVGDRTYADSTRAIFAELLEQIRSSLGRG
jgi:hypothetical protein